MATQRLGRFLAIVVTLVLLTTLAVAAGAQEQKTLTPGGCTPGADYDPACDVDHDGDVDVMDVQLAAGHWNQAGIWMGDNDHDHLGQTWVANSDPLVISGSSGLSGPAPLILSNSDVNGDGLRIESVGRHGVFVDQAGGYGIYATSTGANGVQGVSIAANYYGGQFMNNTGGGGGVYARGGGNEAADLILGGNVVADDGRIYSEPSVSSSDILLYSNDKVHVHLDEDNNSAASNFIIMDGENNDLWSVSESTGAVSPEGSALAVDMDGENTRLFPAVHSPQSWIEDFGMGQLQAGRAVVSLEPLFAKAISSQQPYHVFLTPLGDCPLYVAEKTETGFTVAAVGGLSCDIGFDYRIVGLRQGQENRRAEPFVLELEE
jgi:hypothetical protein